MPPSYTADFVQQANQQNWHPIIIDPQGYAANFIQLMGSASAADGVLGFQGVPLFFSPQDGQAIPEVALFQQWIHRTDPNLPIDIFAVDSWAEARLFVQALHAAGPKATRAGLLAALANIHQFDGNGIVAPADPAGKVPSHCYILWQLHGGQYQRVDSPPVGYRCDGGLAGGGQPSPARTAPTRGGVAMITFLTYLTIGIVVGCIFAVSAAGAVVTYPTSRARR